MIYAFVFGFVAGCVLPPLIIWSLFRYDRRVMRRESRR